MVACSTSCSTTDVPLEQWLRDRTVKLRYTGTEYHRNQGRRNRLHLTVEKFRAMALAAGLTLLSGCSNVCDVIPVCPFDGVVRTDTRHPHAKWNTRARCKRTHNQVQCVV